MIKTQPAKQPSELTKAEAKALTDRIRNAVEDIRKLVAKAHEGKAWKVLGYGSWDDYVKAEFGLSRAHSYRLLQQGEVIAAIEEAVGDLSPMGDIPERVARELKSDLPAAVEEIKERAEQGEDPAKAAKEIAAARRAEKEKAKEERRAQQAEFDRQRDEHRAQLFSNNPSIRAAEEAKERAKTGAKAKPSVSLEDRIAELEAENEELREANASMEAEIAALKAENKKFAEMKVEYEKGGFEEVIAGKDEVIRAQATRIEAESRDKASWKRSADYWKAEAIKRGWSDKAVIDIETGEVIDG